jgi:hypothetical protein
MNNNILKRYKVMYDKVKETLLNDNVVEFVSDKECAIGSPYLQFHFL